MSGDCLRFDLEPAAERRPAPKSQDTAWPGLCWSQLPGSPRPWPRPALRTGEKANEVMSPRPAKLQGTSSQPRKGFIGFVKLASGGQGPPGTSPHHRGKREKQTMKLKGISFPEPRLTHAIQERVSPWLPPPPSYPVFWPLSVVQPRWLEPQPHGDTGFLGSHLGAPGPEIQGPEGFLGKKGRPGGVREVTESIPPSESKV